MALPLHEIRLMASRHGYREIELNERSRLISFRGGPSKSTRINVYYTTGSIGTCLNHPRRGKTQLFRRNITMDKLEPIFDNPRVHTGQGYYQRNSIQQRWKGVGKDHFLCDSARRWVYVGNASGLVKNAEEMLTVTTICTIWDHILWQPNARPDISEVQYACGSHGGLLKMLYEIMWEVYGEALVCTFQEALKVQAGELSREAVHTNLPFNEECANLACFLEAHDADVQELKGLFMSLQKDLRIQLMTWFLSRAVAGHIFVDSNLNQYKSNIGDSVEDCHVEYGQLNYPRKANLCNHCGVLKAMED